ncbi:hypothetical protein Q31b_25230 [Novipirellula aureliae]|uniref:UPF0056 membrane protein n=1 Tax=Novipirellula aureliae TaxID=2527966 RepID=A0A5C6E3L2_9BACT|nr:MarC family protein [Novipirellula aureliae]TWU43482.1 hypothetical protein Q31b_25230 [Novipirellula aureliae]
MVFFDRVCGSVDVGVHLAVATTGLREPDFERTEMDRVHNVAVPCAKCPNPPTLVWVSLAAAAGPTTTERQRVGRSTTACWQRCTVDLDRDSNTVKEGARCYGEIMQIEIVKFIAAIFVISNPVGAIPLFLSLTKEYTSHERRRAALLASVTVAAVLSVNIIVGERILNFFGISIPAFQVGGGIMILLIAVSMLKAQQSSMKHTQEETVEAADKDCIGAVPLGIPLIAGPGAISTVIIFAHRNDTMFDHLAMIGVCVALGLCVWISLRLADPIGLLLGRTGINIGTRLMGLVLAAIAVQFIFDGTHALWNENRDPAIPAASASVERLPPAIFRSKFPLAESDP